MLNRIDLFAFFGSKEQIHSELAVKIQGAMMKAIPTKYASKLHITGYHPYSIYVFPYGSGYVIRVSSLNDEAAEIIRCMSSLTEIPLYGSGEPMLITDRKPYEPIAVSASEKLINGKGCRIEFVTPAMIKTKGMPTAKPDIPAYFYSVVQKYITFEKDCISYDDFLEAFCFAVIKDYELKCEKYNISGHIFPGMTGFCDIVFPNNKNQAELLKKVFAYGSYSGIGGKTGMGMGGINLEPF